MSSQVASSSRLPSLTGMRFVAAAMVFVFHGSLEFLFRTPEIGFLYMLATSTAGFVGVSFFFVLSGFVLTYSARPGDTKGNFFRRRFAKILPNHVVTFVAAIVLLLVFRQAVDPASALANLFLLQAWVPNYDVLLSGNGVAWSLSVEALFYLSFPFLLVLVNKIRPSRLWLYAGAAVLAVLLVPLIAKLALPSAPVWPWGPASYTQIWFVYNFPVSRLFEFALGMILARIVMTGRWIGLGVKWGVALAVVGYVASLFVPFLWAFTGATIIPLALLIPAAAVADVKGRRTFFARPGMVWLGEVSFAFYLVHRLVLTYGHWAFGTEINAFGGFGGKAWSTPVALAFLVAAFAVSLLLSWGLFAWVETPFMRRFGRTPVKPLQTSPQEDVVAAVR
ncbi:acyltransferase [Lentzea sp. HUAS12]|uniref:acyltransferase family protein n=1 Tax=Lentzea sp. HUAS12 TaxID=2951806 RepID=UPI0020A142C8|nr:acyltransferase [Lentzea sp. HUAS12]USX48340.1 acyltransferase [Lentzea sp. HUAS12]